MSNTTHDLEASKSNLKLKFEQTIDLDERTADVQTDDSFDSLMLSPGLKERLKQYGYFKPSPVQIEAIPLGLMGNDLLVQAKSGTGKTLVFSAIASELLANSEFLRVTPRVIVVVPTREIAMQIKTTMKQLIPEKVHLGVFVGGTPFEEDKKKIERGCQVVIGTSGRLCHLVQRRCLNLSRVNLFVLDEADKLMEQDFQNEINFLFSSCPEDKQFCVFSATYPSQIDELLCKYMNTPILIRLNADDVQLLGIKQYADVALEMDPYQEIIRILNSVTYGQCVIFVNEITEVSIVEDKIKDTPHSVRGISSGLRQEERNSVMKELKNFKFRVLVSSDLTARGIDASNVTLVISLGCANQNETYLHRIGRAGRYGAFGAAITILTNRTELNRFKYMAKHLKLKIKKITPRTKLPEDLTHNQAFFNKTRSLIVTKKGYEDHETEESIYEEVYANDTASTTSLATLDEQRDLSQNTASSDTPFLFVPSRKTTKKKYYLRKELLTIRDSIPNEEMKSLFLGVLKIPYESRFLKAMLKESHPTDIVKESKREIPDSDDVSTLELQSNLKQLSISKSEFEQKDLITEQVIDGNSKDEKSMQIDVAKSQPRDETNIEKGMKSIESKERAKSKGQKKKPKRSKKEKQTPRSPIEKPPPKEFPRLTDEEHLEQQRSSTILPSGFVSNQMQKGSNPFNPDMTHKKFEELVYNQRQNYEAEHQEPETSAARGPLVYSRSSKDDYEVKIRQMKQITLNDHIQRYSKLAESLKKQGFGKQGWLMEMRAQYYMLESQETNTNEPEDKNSKDYDEESASHKSGIEDTKRME